MSPTGYLVLVACATLLAGAAFVARSPDNNQSPVDSLASVPSQLSNVVDRVVDRVKGLLNKPKPDRTMKVMVDHVGDFSFQFVKNYSVHKPGYTLLDGNHKMTITSFEATPLVGKSAIYDLNLDNGKVAEIAGTSQIRWPNVPVRVSPDVFGFDALLVGSGFLTPSYGQGGMWIMEDSTVYPVPSRLKDPVKISQPKIDPDGDDWFYHLGSLIDMNGDGKLDVLTSRCHFDAIPVPGAKPKVGYLVWLEQPAKDPLTSGPWKEHVLSEGPDFQFAPKPGNSRADFGVAAAEFLNARLSYYFFVDDMIHSRVIDANLGPGFGVDWTDVNGDGQVDLLATNHVNKNGAVNAYSWTGDIKTADITKHELATGFQAITDGTGTASPGDAFTFQPKVGRTGKPYVFVSGDNSNSIFCLVPNSEAASDWTYTKVELAFLGADIGRASIADTDGDGFVEIYVPAYDNDVIAVFKLGPMSAPPAPTTTLDLGRVHWSWDLSVAGGDCGPENGNVNIVPNGGTAQPPNPGAKGQLVTGCSGEPQAPQGRPNFFTLYCQFNVTAAGVLSLQVHSFASSVPPGGPPSYQRDGPVVHDGCSTVVDAQCCFE